jgi:hypothetical protein
MSIEIIMPFLEMQTDKHNWNHKPGMPIDICLRWWLQNSVSLRASKILQHLLQAYSNIYSILDSMCIANCYSFPFLACLCWLSEPAAAETEARSELVVKSAEPNKPSACRSKSPYRWCWGLWWFWFRW